MMPRTDFEYVLVILEDVSGYTWLRPSRACTANAAVEELVSWCTTLGSLTTWVSENATHFCNRVVRKLAKALGVEHRFSVVNSAWINEIVERMMREVIHGAKAMLNEGGRPLSEWVVELPAVQWALNTAWQKRLKATPYHIMMGREPRTAFTALIDGDNEGFQFSPIDEEKLQQLVVSLVDTQQELLLSIQQRNHQLLQPVFVDWAELKAFVVPLDESSKGRTRLPPHRDVVGGFAATSAMPCSMPIVRPVVPQPTR